MSAASVPRSRRERPAKPALSREWIISATIDIMRREGLAKATMRRVAQALDTGPASLYVYIANTAELHAAVLDELLGTLEVRTEGGWAERLEALLGDYRTLLFTYPGLARSAVVIRPTGSHAIVFIDRLLGLLLEGGVEPTRAAWGVDLLILHVTADAAEHSAPAPDEITSPADREAEWDAISRAIAAADPAAAPHVVAHSEAILSGRPEQRAHWALAVLIAGIAGTPVPDGPA